ncbi:hypothetical protein J6590_073701 [Homalodisca vitripennis]|nr:hypothetical protein J6590_073701 [Homalodisca vitripennis]
MFHANLLHNTPPAILSTSHSLPPSFLTEMGTHVMRGRRTRVRMVVVVVVCQVRLRLMVRRSVRVRMRREELGSAVDVAEPVGTVDGAGVARAPCPVRRRWRRLQLGTLLTTD